MRNVVVTAVCLSIGVLVSGCAKRHPQASAPALAPTALEMPPAPPPPPPEPVTTPLAAIESEAQRFARMTLDELNAQGPLGDVFFDYDSPDLRESELVALQANIRWLERWASTRIAVEGYCDARGTSEYNLALGERRASAVKRYLVSLGLAAERIATVSMGKEQPFCTEDHEDCWRLNRRGHFLVIGK